MTLLTASGRRLVAEPTPDPGSPDWHAQRRTGLGGSDVAIAAGLSRHRTPYDLWLEKTGRKPPEDLSEIEAVQWGVLLEDDVAERYAARERCELRRVNQTLRPHDQSWMMAHLDRRVVGAPHGVEIKTAGITSPAPQEWGDDGTDEIPVVYLCQVQWYMAVLGWERFDVAALIGGRGMRVYPIARDDEMIELLLAAGAKFWRHVTEDSEPDVASIEDARRRWPRSDPAKTVTADDTLLACDRELRIIAAKQKELADQAETLQTQIMAAMADAEYLVRPNARGDLEKIRSWKTQERRSVDLARLRIDEAELCDKYTITTSSRVFRAHGD